jgi:hypothetical protein
MDLTPDEVAKWEVPRTDFERFASLMFNASITQHLTELDAQSLRQLDVGILLVDEARIRAADFSYKSVYVLTPRRDISETERKHWNFPRFTPHPFFGALNDFILIRHHMLGLPQDGRKWADLASAEQLHVAMGFVAVVEPLQEYAHSLKRRGRRGPGRAADWPNLIKGPRSPMH